MSPLMVLRASSVSSETSRFYDRAVQLAHAAAQSDGLKPLSVMILVAGESGFRIASDHTDCELSDRFRDAINKAFDDFVDELAREGIIRIIPTAKGDA